MDEANRAVSLNTTSEHGDKIGDREMWGRCGTINLATGKLENVQEIHFDLPFETGQHKSL